MDHYDYLADRDDDRTLCPECGEPMSSDTDGDGVMTMSYEYCENCGTKDYGEPVRLTEEIIRRMREEEAKPGPDQPRPQ